MRHERETGASIARFGPRAVAERLLRRELTRGRLSIRWPDGAQTRIETGVSGPIAEITLENLRPLWRLMLNGATGFAESYMDGDWDSPDLAALIELAAVHRRARPEPRGRATALRAFDRLRHHLRDNSKDGSRRNIAYHYDLGNHFYEQWLDPTLTYSSAIFASPAQSLEEAQRHKCRRLLDQIDARPGHRVLEIGCGWGHFASLAARERDVRVTAITLSKEQFNFTRERIFREGLNEKVTVDLRDYRDVNGQFDRVASIEMFEAVGEKYWPAFFGKLRESLKSGGRAGLQIITIDDRLFRAYRRGTDFIQKYVFPGGMLPSPEALKAHVVGAGLKWHGDDGFGQHYADTLAVWRERFLAAWPRISTLGFDERFRRMWLYYLAYCEGGFRAGNIDVRQLVLARE